MEKTLTEQLQLIQDDIMLVLKEEQKPLTERELFQKTKLECMSWFGWQFALEKLEKKKLIVRVGNKYNLNNGQCTLNLLTKKESH